MDEFIRRMERFEDGLSVRLDSENYTPKCDYCGEELENKYFEYDGEISCKKCWKERILPDIIEEAERFLEEEKEN